ncbi:MAG: DUF2959 family protein [Planctomycetota bacterium]|nr:DUF2959 family protein [Planctomycetota bacterium]
MRRVLRAGLACVLAGACVGVAGCSSAKIALKEQLGYAKREQLVDAVTDARDEQEKAKTQFASALDEFLAITKVPAGEWEGQYRALSRQHERAKDQADAVRSEIREVDRVAAALFKEWERELGEYNSEQLRRESQRDLDDTRRQYDRLYAAMQAAERKMDPVLGALGDQVLYLKHKLNAAAIAGLQGNAARIETDVSALLREMEAAIAESNRFIEQMRAGAGG